MYPVHVQKNEQGDYDLVAEVDGELLVFGTSGGSYVETQLAQAKARRSAAESESSSGEPADAQSGEPADAQNTTTDAAGEGGSTESGEPAGEQADGGESGDQTSAA